MTSQSDAAWLGRTGCIKGGNLKLMSLHHFTTKVWQEVVHVPRKCGLCHFNPGILIMLTFQKGFTTLRFRLQLGQQSDGWSSYKEELCPHTHLLPSFFFSIYTLCEFTHVHKYIHTGLKCLGDGRNLRAVGLCWATLPFCGHKTKALATWKNSCDLQEEMAHLRGDVWIQCSLQGEALKKWWQPLADVSPLPPPQS